MNCKFCEAELAEGVTLCPACGKENAEEIVTEEIPDEEITEGAAVELSEAATEEMTEEATEEATEETTEEVAEEETAPKKPKTWKIVAAVAGILVAVAVLVGAVLYGTGAFNKTVSYTVSDEKALQEKDTVVATVGNMELTNSSLQMYYRQTIDNFYNQFGYYLDPSILDFTKPLDQQINTAEEVTWQQYFLESALNSWSRYAALCMHAEEAGFALSEQMQANLDSIPQQLDETAKYYGYESADEMLLTDIGTGCDMKGYVEYVRVNMIASQYLDSLYAEMTPTLDEIETYYNENEAELNAQGIVKDGSKTVDVRHILVKPKGDSDADWEACRAQAQQLLDQWKAEGATEDLFIQYATQHTEDPGSMSTGGLYQDVYKGQMVEPFETWCFDESRQYGDTGLVQTDYGYHIMFFVGDQEIWITNVSDTMFYERTMELVNGAVEKWPMDAKYKKVALSDLNTETAE